MKEIIKISAGIPPGPDTPPVSQEAAPCLVVRGPAGAAERVDWGRKKPGRPRFASRDIREKMEFSYVEPPLHSPPTEKEDWRSAYKDVEIMNRNCWQEKGGTYQPPGYSFSASCILCDKGCLCLGMCCLGPRKVSNPSSCSSLKRNLFLV